MANRYRVTYPQAGDVLNPDDWNLTQAELASEINGFADRDNFPEAVVTEAMVVARAASNLRTDPYTTTLTTVADSVAWQSTDGSTTYVGRIAFTAEVDCLLDCDFGGGWNWDTSGHPAGYNLAQNEVNCIRFRISVDGAVVAQSGFHEEGHDQSNTFITGCIPVQAGPHVVTVEYQKVLVTNYTTFEASPLACVLGSRELLVHERVR